MNPKVTKAQGKYIFWLTNMDVRGVDLSRAEANYLLDKLKNGGIFSEVVDELRRVGAKGEPIDKRSKKLKNEK